MNKMNVRITAVVLLLLVVASAAQEKSKKPKKPSTKKQLEMLADDLAALAKLQAEQHDEVMKTQDKIINLLAKDDSCTTPTTETLAACPQPTTSSLGGAACHQTMEGEPWTIVQRRTVGDVNFDQPWASYQAGFGALSGDFWLGNDAINELCPPTRPCQLRVEMLFHGEPHFSSVPRQPDGQYVALYGHFSLAGAEDLYRLSVGQFNSTYSTAGDNLTPHHNGVVFSTLDADHDTWDSGSCVAARGGGGWWFEACGSTFGGKLGAGNFQGLTWWSVTGQESAAGTRMMIREAACPKPTTSSLGGAACDVTTEGGPWTIVQRRTAMDVMFNMSWASYQAGFGELSGDYWLGNDALNELCPPSRPCQLRVELSFPGEPQDVPTQTSGRYVALYDRFSVANSTDLYTLTVSSFDSAASTAGDSLTPHDGAAFSTRDADHDKKSYSCSTRYGGNGGWWFVGCFEANLNGAWAATGYAQGLVWSTLTGKTDTATSTKMMVRVAA